ncbi:MAG: putative SnoaL-like aldol condensation-catalyzing enzyme [Sulfurimonas sp.]|jgi:predicted SnoaL-like aldol condensation-catalyzing enzyme
MKIINKKTVLASVLAVSVFAGTAFSSSIKETNVNLEKQQVVELLNSIENGNSKPIAYINASNYIQHNLGVKDGLAGFGEALSYLPKDSAKVEVVRSFKDGDFVFTHTKYNFFGPKAGFDIFRYEDGKIVEHWDNLQEIADKTASGRTQFDGPTELKDLDQTEQNKELVKNLLNNVFFGKNPSKITEYISTKQYDQHNPGVKDGLAGLGEALKSLADAGMPMVYEKNHMVLGEGNFVLSVSEGQFLNKHVAFYDLFRIENGKAVEHWDTIQNIPEKSAWQNSNGKF